MFNYLIHLLNEKRVNYVNIQFLINSVYTETDINSFISKAFHLTPRFGKVVYKYKNNNHEKLNTFNHHLF